MVQIIIGKKVFDGYVESAYINTVEVDETQNLYESISDAILEGCHAASHLMSDVSVFSGLESSKLSTLMDVASLQYELSEQGVALIVTQVEGSVEGGDSILKIISPVLNPLPTAVDYGYNAESESVNLTDVAEEVMSQYNLFNPNVFIDNPIRKIIDTLPKLSSGGASKSADAALSAVLSELGFQVLVISKGE